MSSSRKFDSLYSDIVIKDVTDETKKLTFDVSGVTTGTTRTFTLPDTNLTIVGIANTATLTNKTIDADLNTLSNIDNADIKAAAAIDATKIADGSVSNTEFQYINSVTSNVQTQLTGKAASGHTHDWDAATGTADTVPFNNAFTAPAHGEGKVFYDKDEHTLAVYNDASAVTHQLGQEGYIRVYNDSGLAITDGKPVYVSGTEVTEDRPTIAEARSDTKSTASVIGVTTMTINNNSFGYITCWGLVNGLDTSTFASGDTLYLDEATAGTLRATPPPEGNYEVQIGYVIKSNATTGRILVALNPNLGAQAGDATELIISVQKGSAGTINAGEVVYITGYDVGADVPEVELADASVSSTMPAFGIARNSFTNSTTGMIVVFGKLINQNTGSFTVGDSLYVSETAGAVTVTKPTGAALVQKIAVVTRSHASNGVIEIFGAGRSNDLPNLPNTNIWVGDGSGVPAETATNTGFNLALGTGAGTVSEGNHVHAASDITSGTLGVARGGTGSVTLTQDGTLIGNGTGAITAIKNNMNASVAPAAGTDDVSLGYAVGSRWFDTTADKEYVCLDATDGVAVWIETTVAGGNGEANTSSSAGGTSLVLAKAGVDLPFKGLTATSTKIALTANANDVGIDVTETNLTLANMIGAPTGAVVGTSDTQTLTNKTLTAPQINDTSADHQYIFGVSELTLDRTITLPLLTGNDTFVFEAFAQTLTNKTLDSTTNTITSDNLHSATTTIDVASATAPTSGQVLTATGGTAATWQTPSASGDVSSSANITDHSIVRGDGGVKGVQDSDDGAGIDWTIADNGKMTGVGTVTGYIFDVHNMTTPSGGNGFRILAGEALGDIAFHVADEDNTFQIMEMEADQGYITIGKTYAQTLTDNGTVYGLDIQHTGLAIDFNTQNGVYRIGGTDVTAVTQTLTNKTINTASNTLTVAAADVTTGTLAVARGGTNIGSYAVGDVLYASGSTVLSKLAGVATGNALISGGVATAPSWGKIGLGTHVSGTLTVSNGGTGVTTLTSGNILRGNGTGAITATLVAPTGAIVGTTDTQTLTNKTFTDNVTTFQDDVTNSKKMKFQLASISASTTRTVTVPDANITLTGIAATQTLTNKTMTSNTNNVISRGLWNTSGGASVSTYAAAAPTTGQVLTATSGTVATWQTPTAAPVFGTHSYYQASEGESTTTSTTLQTKVTLTTGSIATGTYRLGYTCEISNASNGVLSEVEVVLDGTVVALPNMEADNDFLLFGGFVHQSLSSGVRVATIKHRVQTTGTSKIRRARLELYRVS